jgi:hypothetical protein
MRVRPARHYVERMVLTAVPWPRRVTALILAAGVLVAATLTPACRSAAVPGTQESPMDTNFLVSQVKARDNRAMVTAAKLGAPASPALEPLAADSNVEVRLLALNCLESTGGPEATRAALARLNDADEQVTGEALQILHRYPPAEQAGALLTAFAVARFPVVREETPMIAGRLAPKVDPQPWKALWIKERDALVKERLLVGLARMGDADSRTLFVKNLQAARGADAVAWIDYAKYMQDPWIVPGLAKLLDQTEKAMDLAPDLRNTLPQRTCDLAAKALVELTGMKVPFAVKRVQPFSADELNQIRRGLAAAAK